MKFSAICNGRNDQKQKGMELTNPNRGTAIPGTNK